MEPPPVRAVIFDGTNTLWFEAKAPDVERIVAEQARRVRALLRAWGIRVDALEAVLREVFDAEPAASTVERERGALREVILPRIIRGALASRGIAITEQQAEAWWHAAWLPGAEYFGYQLYPDTLDVLRALRERGARVGLISNRPCTGEMLRSDLDGFGAGLARTVDAVVCSGDTGWVKPHPSTFERALSMLRVHAGEAVMVGDSCLDDMAGAQAIGMRAVWKLNGRYDAAPCADADYSIHDLAELLHLPMFGEPLVIESAWPHEDENADRW
ncbi:MAG TPA: HAD-IA family hydrolase [Dehalococcoidia bacterium]|nr:HAD-IA family hydrolase [Dehalococcoidia bacterium]